MQKKEKKQELNFRIGSYVEVDGSHFSGLLSKCATVRSIITKRKKNSFVVTSLSGGNKKAKVLREDIRFPRIGLSREYQTQEDVEVVVSYKGIYDWWPAVVSVADNENKEYQGYLKYSVDGLLVPFTIKSIAEIRKI